MDTIKCRRIIGIFSDSGVIGNGVFYSQQNDTNVFQKYRFAFVVSSYGYGKVHKRQHDKEIFAASNK